MMKKVCLFFALFVCVMQIVGQPKFDPQKFRSELHQYIITKANLTDVESKRLFPIYDEMREKLRPYHDQINAIHRKNSTDENEARKEIIMMSEWEIKMRQIEKKYHLAMLKAVSAVKLKAVLKAEHQFHRQYFKRKHVK
ncbi:MAG: hypothetical protein SOZ07_03080 [Prevotella sp.]|nr:hypothetical protein [Prevotella sp.]MDD7274037.1 hypothetical protein [Prevotellaceae bacterium]MDY3935628.1 hypothetical protein [Prevotella sp.]MDY4217981.1 hypothetical protein [Prevotella sp.]